MKRVTLQRIVVLAIMAIVGIIGTQLYWVQSAKEFQDSNIEIQKATLELEKRELKRQARQDSLNRSEFNDRVKVALTNVAQDILTINNDPAELYKAVEQLRPNYFVVHINDTLNPLLLERLLTEQFDKGHVDEDFRYGIYDCFTDSIVYSNVVVQEESDAPLASGEVPEAPQIKWDTDGHYFSVTFPSRPNFIEESRLEPAKHRSPANINAWLVMAVATLISFGFIAYALWVIMRQKRLSEMKTDFINNMTHELKTPISTISLSSEVLLRPDAQGDKDRIQRYAQIIFDENARLQNQVERVLQLAKLDKGEVDLKLTDLNFHQIIEQAASSFQPQIEQRGGQISLDLGAGEPIIEGDAVHISNIVYNLLDNANKYAMDAPQISIGTANVKDGVQLIIQDNGIGMTGEALKQIFDKFYRVPTGNLHDVKGFGLGLYYVKQLLLKHNGSISATSSPGKGSAFKIWLPSKQ